MSGATLTLENQANLNLNTSLIEKEAPNTQLHSASEGNQWREKKTPADTVELPSLSESLLEHSEG